MSITDTIVPKPHIEILNDILSIQKYAINIASCGLRSPLIIHKKDVDSFTLDYLAAYFSTQITPATGKEKARLAIVADFCTIYVCEDGR